MLLKSEQISIVHEDCEVFPIETYCLPSNPESVHLILSPPPISFSLYSFILALL